MMCFCFLRPMRKQIMSSSYFTAPVALWLTPPPDHISYISKPNNAFFLLFLLNITIIIVIIIFLSNPKPFSKFFWYPELLFLVFIQLLYTCPCQCNLYDDDDDNYYHVIIIIIITIIIYYIIIYYCYYYYYYCYYNYCNSRVFIWMLKA